jgi:lipopolysaccharide/colanic/teichoic acid biosynthesis glycosyltransferase
MRIWPILIDSQPAYLSGGGQATSLLFIPLGAVTLLDHVRSLLEPVTRNALTIVSPSYPGRDHVQRLTALCPSADVVASGDELADRIGSCEPSDVLLVLDPRCLPISDLELPRLTREHAVDPRVAHHLVAFETGTAGTKERVTFDVKGRVRGVLRYYEEATWPFIEGVAATLLPVAAGILNEGALPASLAELRQIVAMRGVPGRDVPIDQGSFDLSGEIGLLAASDYFILRATGAGNPSAPGLAPLCLGGRQMVYPSVRLTGPVIIHPDARIEEHATVLGPAVIGAGAHVGSNAVVARAVVCPGAVVPAGQMIRDRVWCHLAAQDPSSQTDPRAAPPRAWLPDPAIEAGRTDRSRPDHPGAVEHSLKRSLDLAIGTVSLVLLWPVLVLAAAAVWLESKGPIFFGDQREGLHGRAFRCWKFRTMFMGAHAAQTDLKALDHTDGPHFKIERDPRVTRVGRILRATNLDEVPQLFNVLLGQMSLVGPRPSPFRENQICIPWRQARLSVRPGITGLWQVCRHDRSAGDFHQWIEYDLLYIQYFSFWLDLKILLATILTLGGMLSHAPARWLVPRSALGAHDQAAAAAGGRRSLRGGRALPT